jgi:lysozyme family protein
MSGFTKLEKERTWESCDFFEEAASVVTKLMTERFPKAKVCKVNTGCWFVVGPKHKFEQFKVVISFDNDADESEFIFLFMSF